MERPTGSGVKNEPETAELRRKVAELEARAVEQDRRKRSQVQELNEANKALTKALEETERGRTEISALLEGAWALLEGHTFEAAGRGLFQACKKITGAAAGYVALLSEDGAENQVLFLDSGGRPCTVDPELPMPIRGLRETAYLTGKTVYENAFAASAWADFLPSGHVTLENVMFVPITRDGRPVGLIGLANKSGDFTEHDARLAAAFGEMASVALRERKINEDRERLIEQLQKALAEIKTLRGFLPICSHCHKIRDDAGYWQRVEEYIQSRVEVQFSHSICPECARKYYPDIDWDV